MRSDILPRRIPKRYVIVLMVFLGYVNFYYLHTNLGMAVVHMTSSRKITYSNGTVQLIRPEHPWNSIQKALVISSFAYGRFFGPVGAVFAGRIGGATLYSVGILGAAVTTFCMPFCLHFSFYLFVLGSAISGLFESVAYASVSQIWSRWAPPDERAKVISLGGIGTFGGSVVSFLVSGWILHEWGWRVLFHVSGISMFVWFWIWIMVVKNDPSDDKRMSDAERTYIKDRINNQIHKLFVCIGLLFGTLAFLVAGFWPNFVIGIICMCVFQFFGSCTVLDIKILVLDLAPRYAAFMNSVATSFYTASSILTPIAVGFIVTSHSQFQWSICFIILGILYPVIALMFLKFASAELQPWANYSPSECDQCEDADCTNKKTSSKMDDF
ncbi:sodium-dependent phosphate transport protein 3-like isoform X2 [Planococcus citri]|uniref:sodium-dependent phosphate transport protein 3-like isoform X2 n=1 Tax=Planococcus citri TaxID=170843 RepID=UPI0031F84EA4